METVKQLPRFYFSRGVMSTQASNVYPYTTATWTVTQTDAATGNFPYKAMVTLPEGIFIQPNDSINMVGSAYMQSTSVFDATNNKFTLTFVPWLSDVEANQMSQPPAMPNIFTSDTPYDALAMMASNNPANFIFGGVWGGENWGGMWAAQGAAISWNVCPNDPVHTPCTKFTTLGMYEDTCIYYKAPPPDPGDPNGAYALFQMSYQAGDGTTGTPVNMQIGVTDPVEGFSYTMQPNSDNYFLHSDVFCSGIMLPGTTNAALTGGVFEMTFNAGSLDNPFRAGEYLPTSFCGLIPWDSHDEHSTFHNQPTNPYVFRVTNDIYGSNNPLMLCNVMPPQVPFRVARLDITSANQVTTETTGWPTSLPFHPSYLQFAYQPGNVFPPFTAPYRYPLDAETNVTKPPNLYDIFNNGPAIQAEMVLSHFRRPLACKPRPPATVLQPTGIPKVANSWANACGAMPYGGGAYPFPAMKDVMKNQVLASGMTDTNKDMDWSWSYGITGNLWPGAQANGIGGLASVTATQRLVYNNYLVPSTPASETPCAPQYDLGLSTQFAGASATPDGITSYYLNTAGFLNVSPRFVCLGVPAYPFIYDKVNGGYFKLLTVSTTITIPPGSLSPAALLVVLNEALQVQNNTNAGPLISNMEDPLRPGYFFQFDGCAGAFTLNPALHNIVWTTCSQNDLCKGAFPPHVARHNFPTAIPSNDTWLLSGTPLGAVPPPYPGIDLPPELFAYRYDNRPCDQTRPVHMFAGPAQPLVISSDLAFSINNGNFFLSGGSTSASGPGGSGQTYTPDVPAVFYSSGLYAPSPFGPQLLGIVSKNDLTVGDTGASSDLLFLSRAWPSLWDTTVNSFGTGSVSIMGGANAAGVCNIFNLIDYPQSDGTTQAQALNMWGTYGVCAMTAADQFDYVSFVTTNPIFNPMRETFTDGLTGVAVLSLSNPTDPVEVACITMLGWTTAPIWTPKFTYIRTSEGATYASRALFDSANTTWTLDEAAWIEHPDAWSFLAPHCLDSIPGASIFCPNQLVNSWTEYSALPLYELLSPGTLLACFADFATPAGFPTVNPGLPASYTYSPQWTQQFMYTVNPTSPNLWYFYPSWPSYADDSLTPANTLLEVDPTIEGNRFTNGGAWNAANVGIWYPATGFTSMVDWASPTDVTNWTGYQQIVAEVLQLTAAGPILLLPRVNQAGFPYSCVKFTYPAPMAPHFPELQARPEFLDTEVRFLTTTSGGGFTRIALEAIQPIYVMPGVFYVPTPVIPLGKIARLTFGNDQGRYLGVSGYPDKRKADAASALSTGAQDVWDRIQLEMWTRPRNAFGCITNDSIAGGDNTRFMFNVSNTSSALRNGPLPRRSPPYDQMNSAFGGPWVNVSTNNVVDPACPIAMLNPTKNQNLAQWPTLSESQDALMLSVTSPALTATVRNYLNGTKYNNQFACPLTVQFGGNNVSFKMDFPPPSQPAYVTYLEIQLRDTRGRLATNVQRLSFTLTVIPATPPPVVQYNVNPDLPIAQNPVGAPTPQVNPIQASAAGVSGVSLGPTGAASTTGHLGPTTQGGQTVPAGGMPRAPPPAPGGGGAGAFQQGFAALQSTVKSLMGDPDDPTDLGHIHEQLVQMQQTAVTGAQMQMLTRLQRALGNTQAQQGKNQGQMGVAVARLAHAMDRAQGQLGDQHQQQLRHTSEAAEGLHQRMEGQYREAGRHSDARQQAQMQHTAETGEAVMTRMGQQHQEHMTAANRATQASAQQLSQNLHPLVTALNQSLQQAAQAHPGASDAVLTKLDQLKEQVTTLADRVDASEYPNLIAGVFDTVRDLKNTTASMPTTEHFGAAMAESTRMILRDVTRQLREAQNESQQEANRTANEATSALPDLVQSAVERGFSKAYGLANEERAFRARDERGRFAIVDAPQTPPSSPARKLPQTPVRTPERSPQAATAALSPKSPRLTLGGPAVESGKAAYTEYMTAHPESRPSPDQKKAQQEAAVAASIADLAASGTAPSSPEGRATTHLHAAKERLMHALKEALAAGHTKEAAGFRRYYNWTDAILKQESWTKSDYSGGSTSPEASAASAASPALSTVSTEPEEDHESLSEMRERVRHESGAPPRRVRSIPLPGKSADSLFKGIIARAASKGGFDSLPETTTAAMDTHPSPPRSASPMGEDRHVPWDPVTDSSTPLAATGGPITDSSMHLSDFESSPGASMHVSHFATSPRNRRLFPEMSSSPESVGAMPAPSPILAVGSSSPSVTYLGSSSVSPAAAAAEGQTQHVFGTGYVDASVAVSPGFAMDTAPPLLEMPGLEEISFGHAAPTDDEWWAAPVTAHDDVAEVSSMELSEAPSTEEPGVEAHDHSAFVLAGSPTSSPAAAAAEYPRHRSPLAARDVGSPLAARALSSPGSPIVEGLTPRTEAINEVSLALSRSEAHQEVEGSAEEARRIDYEHGLVRERAALTASRDRSIRQSAAAEGLAATAGFARANVHEPEDRHRTFRPGEYAGRHAGQHYAGGFVRPSGRDEAFLDEDDPTERPPEVPRVIFSSYQGKPRDLPSGLRPEDLRTVQKPMSPLAGHDRPAPESALSAHATHGIQEAYHDEEATHASIDQLQADLAAVGPEPSSPRITGARIRDEGGESISPYRAKRRDEVRIRAEVHQKIKLAMLQHHQDNQTAKDIELAKTMASPPHTPVTSPAKRSLPASPMSAGGAPSDSAGSSLASSRVASLAGSPLKTALSAGAPPATSPSPAHSTASSKVGVLEETAPEPEVPFEKVRTGSKERRALTRTSPKPAGASMALPEPIGKQTRREAEMWNRKRNQKVKFADDLTLKTLHDQPINLRLQRIAALHDAQAPSPESGLDQSSMDIHDAASEVPKLQAELGASSTAVHDGLYFANEDVPPTTQGPILDDDSVPDTAGVDLDESFHQLEHPYVPDPHLVADAALIRKTKKTGVSGAVARRIARHAGVPIALAHNMGDEDRGDELQDIEPSDEDLAAARSKTSDEKDIRAYKAIQKSRRALSKRQDAYDTTSTSLRTFMQGLGMGSPEKMAAHRHLRLISNASKRTGEILESATRGNVKGLAGRWIKQQNAARDLERTYGHTDPDPINPTVGLRSYIPASDRAEGTLGQHQAGWASFAAKAKWAQYDESRVAPVMPVTPAPIRTAPASKRQQEEDDDEEEEEPKRGKK